MILMLQTLFCLPKIQENAHVSVSSSTLLPKFENSTKRRAHRLFGRICIITSSLGCISSLFGLAWKAPYGTSWAYLTWGIVWFIATIQSYNTARRHFWLEHRYWTDFLGKTAGLFVLARIMIIFLHLLLPLTADMGYEKHQQLHYHVLAYRWGVYLSGTWVHILFWRTLLRDPHVRLILIRWYLNYIQPWLVYGLRMTWQFCQYGGRFSFNSCFTMRERRKTSKIVPNRVLSPVESIKMDSTVMKLMSHLQEVEK